VRDSTWTTIVIQGLMGASEGSFLALIRFGAWRHIRFENRGRYRGEVKGEGKEVV
jgi:hypothetical protein